MRFREKISETFGFPKYSETLRGFRVMFGNLVGFWETLRPFPMPENVKRFSRKKYRKPKSMRGHAMGFRKGFRTKVVFENTVKGFRIRILENPLVSEAPKPKRYFQKLNISSETFLGFRKGSR
jgi:hypothetical protein